MVRRKYGSDWKGRETGISNWDQFLIFAKNIP